MTGKRCVEDLVSAGGVVYGTNDGELEVVVCGRLSPPVWGLPKGTPDPGESREETALREVREETGLEVEIERFIHKTVLYYLMSSVGGDISLHDHEFDEVRWLPADRACETMTYENEAEVVKKGLSLVQKGARAG